MLPCSPRTTPRLTLAKVVKDSLLVTTFNLTLKIVLISLPSQEMCLGYYIGYVRERTVVKTNCLRTSPYWMQQLQPVIGDMKINHVKKISSYTLHVLVKKLIVLVSIEFSPMLRIVPNWDIIIKGDNK